MVNIVSIEGSPLEVAGENTPALSNAPKPLTSGLVPIIEAYAKVLEELVLLANRE